MSHNNPNFQTVEEVSWNPNIAPVVDGLLDKLSMQLKTTDHDFESLATLADARDVTCFDMYKETIKPVSLVVKEKSCNW